MNLSGRHPEAWAVVVAGGTGSRFGALKQFADLAGRPVLAWSLASARQACRGVVAVLPPEVVAVGALDPSGWEADAVVAGGPSRSASVRAGLGAVPLSAEIIAVHDAARPLVALSVWRAVLAAVTGGADAAIPVIPVTDTVKEVATDGTLRTLDRNRLVAVQTPQAFRAGVLRRAHSAATDATDDAALVEALGGRVERVPGSSRSMKITSPDDLVMAAALIAREDPT
ncbi:MAG: 2-C-methyl-D-erythritol 4-phosphate cytidylyltransferase [Actinomycetota bacterium]|nr:2-C-methyl-D-erythritol 4-phosphate cytidylyltransferase [Actinomycetota bacterium]